jgi:enamine deaminase RidA (YjgF/YER057c/UK114 family)
LKRARLNPPKLSKSHSYAQITTVEGATRIAYISGQTASDKDGQLIGPGDFRAQVEATYQNVATALEAIGATWANVMKLTTYVVDYRPEYLKTLQEIRLRFIPADEVPASTLVGVPTLAAEGWLVEIEAVVAL